MEYTIIRGVLGYWMQCVVCIAVLMQVRWRNPVPTIFPENQLGFWLALVLIAADLIKP